MRLTKKKAMEICIELWTYLAETGNKKEDWPGWEKYGEMNAECPLCEYGDQNPAKAGCNCPLDRPPFNGCYNPPSEYENWVEATRDVDEKRFAGLFLKQLKEIKWG